MIEVFKTSLTTQQQAHLVEKIINESLTHVKMSFDLEDIDHVLRIQGEQFSPKEVIIILGRNNFKCEVLSD
ncbi:MAG: hypothetical protein KI790_03675 [Cyclobacteriaceae bacterium]|nr:hypothetical protein [Cyclobacteriaceae bacterium HetDA_MAG_MS6]